MCGIGQSGQNCQIKPPEFIRYQTGGLGGTICLTISFQKFWRHFWSFWPLQTFFRCEQDLWAMIPYFPEDVNVLWRILKLSRDEVRSRSNVMYKKEIFRCDHLLFRPASVCQRLDWDAKTHLGCGQVAKYTQSVYKPREYLKGPKVYIKKKVKRMGYKTCHVLKNSLDASVCAKDCESMKKQKFAKDCKKNGGLFKCCIRRDAAFCHECRCRQSPFKDRPKKFHPGFAAHLACAPTPILAQGRWTHPDSFLCGYVSLSPPNLGGWH